MIETFSGAKRPSVPGPVQYNQYNLKGTLVFDYGLAASGITVLLYNIGFGGQDVKLGETKSDAQGNYSISYNVAQGALVNLQVRALDSSNEEVTISNTKFNAQSSEILNLVVPAAVQPLAPEFMRPAADLDKAIGGIAKLSQDRESSDRQDLTLFNQFMGFSS